MKTLKINTAVLAVAADEAGMTMEGYVGHMRSLSLGREVCAHFARTEGPDSVFICE